MSSSCSPQLCSSERMDSDPGILVFLSKTGLSCIRWCFQTHHVNVKMDSDPGILVLLSRTAISKHSMVASTFQTTSHNFHVKVDSDPSVGPRLALLSSVFTVRADVVNAPDNLGNLSDNVNVHVGALGEALNLKALAPEKFMMVFSFPQHDDQCHHARANFDSIVSPTFACFSRRIQTQALPLRFLSFVVPLSTRACTRAEVVSR